MKLEIRFSQYGLEAFLKEILADNNPVWENFQFDGVVRIRTPENKTKLRKRIHHWLSQRMEED